MNLKAALLKSTHEICSSHFQGLARKPEARIAVGREGSGGGIQGSYHTRTGSRGQRAEGAPGESRELLSSCPEDAKDSKKQRR